MGKRTLVFQRRFFLVTAIEKGRDFGVLSSNTWRVSDLGAKHELLRAALGWGSMPLHPVEEDLACNRLKTLAIDSLLARRDSAG